MSSPKTIIIDTINRVYSKGLTTTSGGNLSVIDDSGNIFITPSGKDKGTLLENDIVQVLPDGSVLGDLKPSIELPFHSLIYKLRPDVRAVLHVHSPFLVSFSLLNSSPDIKIIPLLHLCCKNVGLSLYDIPGSIELGQQIAKYIEQGYDSVMMQNHGVVLVADTMDKAYQMLESLELCAEICLKAKMLSCQPYCLDDKELALYAAPDFKPSAAKFEQDHLNKISQMQAFSHRCYVHKFFGVNSGTISLRISEDEFLITAQDCDRNNLSIDDFVIIKSGTIIGKKCPAYDYKMHREIYLNKPQINSLFESISPNIMAFGVTQTQLSSRTIPESYIMMRDVVRMPYASNFNNIDQIVGSISLASPVVLIENSCVVASGESITKAFDRLEVSDITAKNLLLCKVLGQPCEISDAEILKIDKHFNLLPKQ